MIEIGGKQVFTELDELVDPAHTALVVVDMQRDFCVPGWAFDRLGVDISMYPPMIPRLARLIEGARAAGVLVIYIQMTVLPNGASDSPAQIRFNLRLHLASHGDVEPLRYTADGSEGQAIIDELAPQPGDLVVKKYRSSAFWGTNLDLVLGSNGIKSVVMTGATTEGCVESTARDALFNDYYVVVAEDCVASDDPVQHDASLLLMRHRFDIATSDEIGAIWSATGPVGAAHAAHTGSDSTH
jgi:nicotinamidase-related amidase